MMDTHILSLPQGWIGTRVGDICAEINYGYTASASAERSGPRFLRITDIQDGQVQWASVPYCAIEREQVPKYALNVGDIVFARTGGTVGKSFLITSVPEESVFASYLIRLSAHAGILPKFLYYFFQSGAYWEQIGIKKGGLQGNVNATTLSSLELPICPFNEQVRIVAKIEELFSELDNGIGSLKAGRQQLQVYRQALLKNAFEGKITAQWRAENKDRVESASHLIIRIREERSAHYQSKLSAWNAGPNENRAKPRPLKTFSPLGKEEFNELPTLPDGWIWEKLGWMTSGVEYGTAAKSSKAGEVPVLRMGNIQNGKFDWSDLVYTSDKEEILKYALTEGDILFNRTNSPELVGKTAIYRGERPALFAGYLIRVNQIATIVDRQYLNFFLNSHVARKHGNRVKTDGVNQSNINGEKLCNYPFPYCSLSEQIEIVKLLEEKFSLVDQMEQDIGFEVQKAESLRQSILKKAFSGGLVAQDPNDEPARLLLERIDAGKARSKNGNKKLRERDAA